MSARLISCLLVVAFAFSLSTCSTSPSGRSQLMLLSADQETAMGVEAFQEVKQSSPLSTNQEWNSWVQNAGRRISAVVDRPGFNWEFRLIAEQTVNAFCLPGGKVAFYEGIMPICQNEAGVAVVMGHEIAHAVARHGGERVSQNMLTQAGAAALTLAFSNGDPGTQQMVSAAFGMGAQVGILLPFSRKHESEADYLGLRYMAEAGYDPSVAPDFWRRMAAQSKGDRGPEFMATHPNPETRVVQLEEWMPEALEIYRRSQPR